MYLLHITFFQFVNSIINKEENLPTVTKFVESDFAQDCLHWHNNFREIHEAPPLIIDEQVVVYVGTNIEEYKSYAVNKSVLSYSLHLGD